MLVDCVLHVGFALVAAGFGASDVATDGDAQCGSRCLYVALKGLDYPVKDLAELESRLGAPPIDGYTLAQLEAGAKSYGAHTLGVETTVENLRLRPKPFACIAHLTRDHFVLIADLGEGSATIIDPPHKKSVPLDTLGALWDRKALLISSAPLAREEDLLRPIPWRAGSPVPATERGPSSNSSSATATTRRGRSRP